MTSLRKNKKAGEGPSFSLVQLIGIVVAIIVVVGFAIPFVGRLYALFTNTPDEGTLKQFEAFADQIERTNEQESPSYVEYYIVNGIKVVGFNKNKNNIEDYCGINSMEAKPAECGTKACLALCSEDENGCRQELKAVRVFENINTIKAHKDLESNFGLDGALALYGRCNVHSKHGIQRIKIERSGNEITISPAPEQ